ncbi:hypothetical protein ABW19_dt0208967 [Dactylella cylindrospora]|nr:hypothetical protein ABW19_dt0208967 [Dactylella cylindrospora]
MKKSFRFLWRNGSTGQLQLLSLILCFLSHDVSVLVLLSLARPRQSGQASTTFPAAKQKSVVLTSSHFGPCPPRTNFPNRLLILFEHRFYGESALLTDVSENLYYASRSELTDFYKYHTIEQALEDVVVFANNFTYGGFEDLTPDKTPWVWIGVSYSGARGAWITKRNPGLFKATLASSAPVQLKVNFWEYFTAVEDALAVNNQNCSADLHAAANWLSEAWENKDASLVDQLIEAVYEPSWSSVVEEYSSPVYEYELWDARKDYMQDAAWTAFSDFQYYGVQGGTLGLFCDMIETTYDTQAPSEGIFATETLERAVAAYAGAVALLSPYSYTSGRQISPNIEKRQAFPTVAKRQYYNYGGFDPDLDSYSWFWQVCTEFGAFQVANMSRPENLIPSFINVTAQIDQCVELFGESEQVSLAGPNVDPINQKYQGWYVELSNTLWVNGEFDPWRALSVDSEEADAPTNDTATTDIPQCGQSFSPGTQLRYVIQDGYHGSEFSEEIADSDVGGVDGLNPTATIGDFFSATRRTTSTRTYLTGTPVVDASNAQSLWFSALSTWLPCTTLDFAFTSAAPTTSTPFSSRTPFPTNEAAEESGSGGNNSNAASPVVIPGLMIPFIVSIFAFVAGLRIVL